MSTSLDKFYSFDKEKAFTEGVKYNYSNDQWFLLRYFNPQSPRMKAALLKYHRPYARQLEAKTLPEDISFDLTLKLFFDISVGGWAGMELDGKAIECNQENFVALMKAACKENNQAYLDLYAYASDIFNFKPEHTPKEVLGNSSSAT